MSGDTMRARLAARGELRLSEAVRVLRSVADTLAAAHVAGQHHGDVRPEHIAFVKGAPTLDGFGGTTPAESPAYVSPEQATGGAVDARSDVFAFGVLAYELLTGETPFAGRSQRGQLAANISEKPEAVDRRRPSVPAELSALVMRCLEKDPGDRPQMAAELVTALSTIELPPEDIEPLNLLAALESDTVVARSEYYRNRGVLMLLLIVVVIAGWAGYSWWQARRANSAAVAATPSAIAVLPLANASGDPSTEYFTGGVTDEITRALAAIPGVNVAPRGATDDAGDADGAARRKHADRLHVDALLSGSVRRTRDSVHLTASLGDVSGGAARWSATYAAPIAHLSDVETKLARAVAAALGHPVAASTPAAPRTSSTLAHDDYLRGRFAQRQATEPALRASVSFFERALREDSSFARAWSGLADSWLMLAEQYAPASEALAPLRDAVARGMAIDSTIPALRLTRGAVEFYFDHDPLAAQRDIGNALAADPELEHATGVYPQVLWTNALRDSASAYLKHAADGAPASYERLFHAWAYSQHVTSPREARDYCGLLGEIGRNAACEAMQDVDVGRPDAALALFSPSPSPSAAKAAARVPHAQLDYVAALVVGRKLDDARAFVADVAKRAPAPGASYVGDDDIALMYGLLGDNDQAMAWFERALAAHAPGIGALYWRTLANPVRKDARLVALAKRAGLPNPPPYWP